MGCSAGLGLGAPKLLNSAREMVCFFFLGLVAAAAERDGKSAEGGSMARCCSSLACCSSSVSCSSAARAQAPGLAHGDTVAAMVAVVAQWKTEKAASFYSLARSRFSGLRCGEAVKGFYEYIG